MKQITARDNPTLKSLRALMDDARHQRAQGRSVIEGPHLVAAALDHGALPDLIVVSAGALGHAEITTLIERLGAIETLCLPDALFRGMSELATPLGILARIAIPPAPAFPATPQDWLLLDAIQDAGNVGTLLRTAAAAGLRHVALGSGCAHAWMPKTLRAAQGAHFALAVHENVDLAALLDANPDLTAMTVAAVAHAGMNLYSLDLTGAVAWMFGSEGAGLSPALSARARRRATIPLATGSESLNVAAAAAACLFEMRRQRCLTSSGHSNAASPASGHPR